LLGRAPPRARRAPRRDAVPARRGGARLRVEAGRRAAADRERPAPRPVGGGARGESPEAPRGGGAPRLRAPPPLRGGVPGPRARGGLREGAGTRARRTGTPARRAELHRPEEPGLGPRPLVVPSLGR